MSMRGRGVLMIAIGVAALASILPIATSVYLSNIRAVDAERTHLAEYANWTLLRARKNLEQAFDILAVIDKDGWKGCSPAHIARMRQLASESEAVEEIGYVEDGRVICSNWGPTLDKPSLDPPDRMLDARFGLKLDVTASGLRTEKMMSIAYGKHNVLVKPGRLVDVLRDTKMSLGIAFEQGPVIAVSGTVDPGLIRRLTARPMVGMDERHIFASLSENGLTAFAVSERDNMRDRIRHELWVMVPIGLLMSALLVGIVIWISRQRLSIPNEIATGIKKREFVAYYQPIVALDTGRCVGAEALVRWRRPDGGIIPPVAFVPIAEDLGLMTAITDQVIDQVVEDLAAMLATDDSIHVAINICAEDIESGRFLPVLRRALRRHGVAPAQIWLEATERGFIHADAARTTLARARADGHKIAIDDFGTGYSSLSLLEQLPLDALKIDRSFVESIGKGAATSVVTQHIVKMAQELQLTLIAEGIETPEQQAYLRSAGVELGQGWLYAQAMPANDFLAYVTRNHALDA